MGANNTARIAFVGAGGHATGSLYPNIPLIPEFELVAVCDIDATKAEDRARRYGARPFIDVGAMLDAVQPDGVCVCGPPEMHHGVGLQVLRRGIPVFMDKPPAPSLAGAKELAAAADENGAWGMVGFMKRFAPANIVVREFMQSDAFGKLSSITLIHGAMRYDDMRRMLYFNGIHMIDLARFLGGDVTSVFAHGASDGTQAVSVSMQFAGGAVGQLNMNSGHPDRDCFEQTYISGAGAGILIDASREVEVMSDTSRFADGAGQRLFGWSNRYYVSGNMAGWEAGGHYTRGYWGELNHFAQAVLGNAPPTSTLDDGVQSLRLIDAILESVASGAPVSL